VKWIIFIPHLSIPCYITVRHFIETYEQLLKLQQKKTVDLVFLDKCIKKLKYPRVISSSINAVDLSTFLQGISNFSFTENLMTMTDTVVIYMYTVFIKKSTFVFLHNS